MKRFRISAPPFLKEMLRAFKNRNYRLFFAGQGISLIGTWMQQIAMGWYVYRLTNSSFLLGLVAFSANIPSFFLTPVAGVLSDRYNRHKMLIFTQSFAMLQASILAFLVLNHYATITHIICLCLFLGTVNAFDAPIRQAFVADLIENRNDLGNAIALNSGMFNSARLIGPSVAGLLISYAGEGVCFLINALSYIAVLTSLSLMKLKPRVISPQNESPVKNLKEGFSYAYNHRPIRMVLTLVANISIMGMAYSVLLPVFARDILHGGPNTLGFLMGAVGIGAVVGAGFMASRKNPAGFSSIIPRSSSIFGISLMLFSFSETYWLSLIFMFCAGFGMMTNMACCNTLIQTISDEDKRGRVISLYVFAFIGMAPFGSLASGWLSSHIGAPRTLLLCGTACLMGGLNFARGQAYFREATRPVFIKKGLIKE